MVRIRKRIIMNYNNYIVYDYETSSVSPYRTQPLSLGAVPIDGRRLEILDDVFYSLIKPIFDPEECKFYNLDPIQDEALEVNKLTREELETALPLKLVWEQFCHYINQYNCKKTKWTAPIACYYNGLRFDQIITDRIAGGQNRHLKMLDENLKSNIKNLISAIKEDETIIKTDQLQELFKLSTKLFTQNECWGFGPWENNECTLFHPRDSIDLMKMLFWWTENLQEIRSISLNSIREWLGITTEGAHNAQKDVLDCAQILIRFLKYTRKHAINTKFAKSFKEL